MTDDTPNEHPRPHWTPRALRVGSHVTVDGCLGTVQNTAADKVFVTWFTGDPIRMPDGRILGWPTERSHHEWIPRTSPRLTAPTLKGSK